MLSEQTGFGPSRSPQRLDMKVTFPALFFLYCCILRCVVIPILAARAVRRRKPRPGSAPAKRNYVSGIIWTAGFAGIAIVAAIPCRIPVFGSSRLDFKMILLALAFLLLNLSLASLEWKYSPNDRRKRLASYLPHTARERVYWVFASMAAGVGEEIIFRAVLFGLLFQMTGNYWVSAIISALFFGLYHIPSGLMAAVTTFLPALGLQWLVFISGGLYAAIVVHFLYDLINGIVYGASAMPEREGYLERPSGEVQLSGDAPIS
jgi:membrane protease YdiL (CAAX protease family)